MYNRQIRSFRPKLIQYFKFFWFITIVWK
jgi:hypothetical protein